MSLKGISIFLACIGVFLDALGLHEAADSITATSNAPINVHRDLIDHYCIHGMQEGKTRVFYLVIMSLGHGVIATPQLDYSDEKTDYNDGYQSLRHSQWTFCSFGAFRSLNERAPSTTVGSK